MKFTHLYSLGLLLALSGCQPEITTSDKAALAVSTLIIDKPIVHQMRDFKGQVIPAEQTPMAFRMSGALNKINVKAGQHVVKGEVLATLKDNKTQQALKDALAQYTLAKKQFMRGSELYQKKMISSANFDQLRANKILAQSSYELSRHQQAYTQLRAPFSGQVLNVNKEVFEQVTPGETVLSVYQNKKVYVQIELSDTILSQLTSLKSISHSHSTATFSGLKTAFSMNYLEHANEPNQQTHTYPLVLVMPQVTPEILPGSSANIRIDLESAGISQVTSYRLPMTALQAGEKREQFYIWIARQDENLAYRAHKIAVHVGQINGVGALVSGVVKQGDNVINSNLRKLREGMPIKIVESGAK